MSKSKKTKDQSGQAAENVPISRDPRFALPNSTAVSLFHSKETRPIRANLARRLAEALADSGKGRDFLANGPELAQALIQDAVAARASDIHLEPSDAELRVRLRIDGIVSDAAHLTSEQGRALANQFKALADLDPVVRFAPKDSHAHVRLNDFAVDLRLALAPCQRGEALSIRLLDPKRLERSIDDLGLTEANLQQLEDWLDNVNGLFLAAGPTGCGKTTTVYSLLHKLKFADRTVVSLEDPVEYEIPGTTQVQLDEKHHLSGSSTFLVGKGGKIVFSGGAYDTGENVSTDLGAG